MTLAEFLLARFGEDSSVAFFAQQDEQLLGSLADQAVGDGDHRLTHAARWTPERVLAQCKAREQIVEAYLTAQSSDHGGEMRNYGYEEGLEQSLRHLALPYADHPDFLEEWRP